jgi:spore coat protein CotF
MEFKITASEAANLWLFITSNKSSMCLLEHGLRHVDDTDTKRILEHAKQAAEWIIHQASVLYEKAGFPNPIGFGKEDVTLDAPRLFSDRWQLFDIQIMSQYGLSGYSLAYGECSTPVIREFLSRCIEKTRELNHTINEVIVQKGQAAMPIYPNPSDKAEMIQKRSFLSGWFGHQRPMNLIEVNNILFSLRGVILAKTKFMAFSQIARDEKVKTYCARGTEMCAKRIELLQSIMTHEQLPFQATFETEVTDSTTSPFSDRLIMYRSLLLCQLAIARYGTAFSTSTRKDFSTTYTRLIAETSVYAEDGLNLMIDKEWYEQPPLITNRDQLAKQ